MRLLLPILLMPLFSFAQLQVAKIFSSNMVLQREMPVHIYGTAAPAEKITVTFSGLSKHVTTSANGNWDVYFKKQSASKQPQVILISSASEHIQLNNILVGDTWLCIGQSNMEFPLRDEMHYQQELPQTDQPLIRIYNPDFIGKNYFGKPFTDSMMQQLYAAGFYQGQWQLCDSSTAKSVSAIGYYFGKRILASEDIPVGLINLAIGGAPLETFIRKEVLLNDKSFSAKVSGNWLLNDALPVWIRQRAAENIGKQAIIHSDEIGIDHAFKPGFAYEAGIHPILGLAIRGVLLYQGESNAQEVARVREYGMLMKTMVDDYRLQWKQPTLPFYWMQLSSIDSSSYASRLWPEFRNEQRIVMDKITNGYMAVCSDLGAKNNVHPTNKKEPAERLARWALNKTYHRNIIPSGPLPVSAVFKNGKIILSFHYAKNLQTSYGQSLRGFSVDGVNEVQASIIDDQVILPSISKPRFIYYGWKPFTDANLVNGEQLPASTFKIIVQ